MDGVPTPPIGRRQGRSAAALPGPPREIVAEDGSTVVDGWRVRFTRPGGGRALVQDEGILRVTYNGKT